jgi:hypothetical protein
MADVDTAISTQIAGIEKVTGTSLAWLGAVISKSGKANR